jgi:hypothetical protein
MTDPTAPGTTPAGQPAPMPPVDTAPGAPPTPPTAPPQKKSNALKIVLIVLGAVVVLCGIGIFALVKVVSDALDFSVGNCVNVSPVSEVAVPVDPVAVSCDSPEAESKIVAVHEGATLLQADTLCADAPGFIGALQVTIGSNTKLLCLADNS